MEAYSLSISRVKLSETNRVWNESRLNKPWVVGSTSKLINQRKFKSKEEWREFYFESGRQRNQLIAELAPDERKSVVRTLKGNSSYQLERINYNYGRTKEELYFIGDLFFAEIQKTGNPLRITKSEARYMVLYRVIAETWNGIALTEPRIRKRLQEMLNWSPIQDGIDSFEIKTVSNEVDGIYEVDAEVFNGNTLVCAIQIKPVSYKKKFDFAEEARKVNEKKNEMYREKFSVPVLYVYGSKTGYVENTDVVREIKKLKAGVM